jgi:L-ascorbate metabolism protein UlaG (beta-lactamase superfamily)
VNLRWFGQSAFLLEDDGARVAIDPVGDGTTVGGERAAAIVEELAPRLVVPMHYRTAAIDFLEPPDAFLAALPGWQVDRLAEGELSVESIDAARIVLPAAPVG